MFFLFYVSYCLSLFHQAQNIDLFGQCLRKTSTAILNSNHAQKSKFKLKFCFFGYFSAKLGPETHSNGSGLTNCAERTINHPWGPISRSFPGNFLVSDRNLNLKLRNDCRGGYRQQGRNGRARKPAVDDHAQSHVFGSARQQLEKRSTTRTE